MLFTEPTFLFLFLPLLLGAYFAAPAASRNGILLAASLLFYAAGEGAYLLVMLGSVAGNYLAALAIARAGRPRARTALLAAAMALNLAMLAAYKYAAFLTGSINVALAALGGPMLAVPRAHLPIGISFFTFQTMSYVVDVYRGTVPAQRSPFRLALYVALFPQLIAGPIVRYATVARQLCFRRITSRSFLEGCRRFVIGLGKKMLVANGVAATADAVFALPIDQLGAATAWLGAICYALQIYFDFSGYSDMAIGLGLMFGFRFPENFRHPYVARSISEFWRRWHITLSSWFRDYLYIPLGGNRVSRPRVLVNLLVVFLLCGLWHGASWVFVLWGLLHGALLVLERLGLGRWMARRSPVLQHAYVVVALLVTWVFFRSETAEMAVLRVLAMGGLVAGSGLADVAAHVDARLLVALAVGVVGSTPVASVVAARWRAAVARGTVRAPWVVPPVGRVLAAALLALVFAASLVMVAAETHDPFIYFRF